MGGIEVDPQQLASSGKTVGAQGDALITALGALDAALSASGLMCGTDNAGLMFTTQYLKSGQAVVSAVEAAVNAFRKVGYGIEVSAFNYAHSDAASTVGGGTASVSAPTEPAKYAGPAVPGSLGIEVSPPMLWSLIEEFVYGSWPNGNAPTIHAAAAAWRTFGTTISTASTQAEAVGPGLAGHDIPESEQLTTALSSLVQDTSSLAGQCNSLASSMDSFADEVQSSQDAIRDLLHRLSLSGVLNEIGSIFSGHNPIDDLKKIAHDVDAILHTLSRELDAVSSAFQMLTDGLDSVIRSFEAWDRKEFTHFFGNQVGNILADHVNGFADIEEGAAKSVLGLAESIPTMLAHPVDTAKGILSLDKDAVEFFNPINAVADPEGYKKAGEHLLDAAKGVVDYQDWTSDRPLVGLGNNVGNIAQVLIPGAGEAKAGLTAGRAGEEAAQVTRAESTAVRGGVRAFGEGGGKGIADQAGKLGKDLDGLNLKPVDTPVKAPEPPAARPAEPGPAPKPADTGAAAGNAGAGKAPVDAAPRPAGEPTAPHGPAAEPSTGAHGPGERAPVPTSAPPAADGAHAPVHESAPVHASTAEATAPHGSTLHEAPAQAPRTKLHRHARWPKCTAAVGMPLNTGSRAAVHMVGVVVTMGAVVTMGVVTMVGTRMAAATNTIPCILAVPPEKAGSDCQIDRWIPTTVNRWSITGPLTAIRSTQHR